jgi:flagella basal body P-ring formation protein FlgA
MKNALIAALLCVPAVASANEVAGQIQLLVEREAGPANRVEVTIGSPSSRMQLAPCARMEPFIPNGTRLWGRATLGVRCVSGATWQAFLPVHIRVFGMAPVAARPLATGENVTEADIRHEEVELSLYPLGAIADISQVSGKQLIRPVTAGQTLLGNWFRARQVLAQGDTVRVVYAGPGFSVSAEGRALTQALEGQAVRVAMESGRTVTGVARADRVVEISY